MLGQLWNWTVLKSTGHFETKLLILGFYFDLFFLLGKRGFEKAGTFKTSIYLLIYLLPNRVTWIWSFSGKGHETCSPFWKHFIAACVGKAPTMESTQGHGGGTWNSWCWVLRMWQRHQGGCSRQLQFCEEGRAHFWPGQGPKDFVVDATYIRVCCHGELGILDLLFARMHLWSSINKISSLLLEGWRVETPQPFWIGLVLVVARSAA